MTLTLSIADKKASWLRIEKIMKERGLKPNPYWVGDDGEGRRGYSLDMVEYLDAIGVFTRS